MREETGVWAEIVKPAGMQEYEVDGQPVRVQFYLMKAKAEGRSEDRWRKHEWLPLYEARDLATPKETKDLLSLAEAESSTP